MSYGSWSGQETKFSELLGKTLASVTVNTDKDVIDFATVDGENFRLYHGQDCCESVTVDSVVGDLQDLIGEPLTLAEEATSDTDPEGVVPEEYRDSFTWTFYKLATRKGYVDIRWYGSSNGYYSESVSFDRVAADSAVGQP